MRFPVEDESPLGAQCPFCGAPTTFVDDGFHTDGAPAPRVLPPLRLEALLDNVRSLSNVGSIFRTADGAGIAHLHLGGITPTPAHPKLAKTALGAEQHVAWSHDPDAARAAESLVAGGARLWGIEGGDRSRSLYDPATLDERPTDARLVLVVGHEVSGVDPRILALCERVVHVPMAGVKDSLNVSVALGIVAYTLRFS